MVHMWCLVCHTMCSLECGGEDMMFWYNRVVFYETWISQRRHFSCRPTRFFRWNIHVVLINTSGFFLGGRRGTRTPKHFVSVRRESKNFKMLEFPLNQLQTYYGYLCDLLSFM
jgi:hypothetical protein